MRDLKGIAKAYFVFVFCLVMALVFTLGFFVGERIALSEPCAVMCQVPEALR